MHHRLIFLLIFSLFAASILKTSHGGPAWSAQKWNKTEFKQWMEYALLSDESDENPLLMTSHAAQIHNMLFGSEEEFEKQTMEAFRMLKMNYTHVLKSLDVDKRSAWGWRLPHTVGKALLTLIESPNNAVQSVENGIINKVSCMACKAGIGLLQHYVRAGKTKVDIVKVIYEFCITLTLQMPRVCMGMAELMGGEAVYVLQRITIGPEEVCSFALGDACGHIHNPTHEWQVMFPPVPKPPVQPPTLPVAGAVTFKVLQLSDYHYDPYYVEGTNAACVEPLCCRVTSGPAPTPAAAAGRWGDYRNCDTPKRTIDHMLQHIASTHPDIDYILWTGDLPPHDIWNQTREENLMVLKQTVEQVTSLFPGIPIFPALGNHESAPVNSFPPPFIQNEYSIDWLYSELDEQWRKWLPTSVSRTVRRGAFYSVLVRPGFRIISLNMNYCNNKNWWLLLNSTDPAKELQWFIYELQSAEFNGEKVHVIGHIPPGYTDCLKEWSRNYYDIINRYESTITAQFFGHTHFDEFELFYDNKDLSRAINVAYIGPSVTPYFDLNPGYRIYYVDGDHDLSTRMVVDHETWIMNLKEANLYNYPIWFKLYNMKSAFQMPSLLPQELDSLVNRMAENKTEFEEYYRFYWKNSHLRPKCNNWCKKQMICDMRSGRSHDRSTLCKKRKSRIDAKPRTGWRTRLYNRFSG